MTAPDDFPDPCFDARSGTGDTRAFIFKWHISRVSKHGLFVGRRLASRQWRRTLPDRVVGLDDDLCRPVRRPWCRARRVVRGPGLSQRGAAARPPGLDLGAKLWYPLVLCLLPLAGAASGAAFGAHRVCDRLIEDALKPALVAAMPGLRQAMAERLAPLSGDMTVTARDLVRPIVQDLLYEPADDSFSERLKARLFNGLLYKAGAFALTQAFSRALDALPEVVKSADSRASGDLAAFGAQSVMSVLAGAGARADFSQLDKSVPQIFTEAMHEQTAALFAGVYLSIALYAVGLAMAIACEALLYFRFYLPRRAQPGLAPVA